MKTLSYWALLNPKKTIAILSVLHLLTAILAIYLGVLLFAEGILLSKSLIYVGLILFFLVQIFYPIRHARHKLWKANYARQKVMDVILVGAYLLAVTANTNIEAHAALKVTGNPPGFAKQIVYNPVVEESNEAAKNSFWKNNKHQKKLKKQFKKFVTEVRKQAGNSDYTKEKVVGIVLLMIILMLLVAALACMLGASDMGGVAAVVLVGGWVLVLVLGVKLIRKLKGEKPNNYEPATD